MADKFGKVAIPIPAPTLDVDTVSDPGLDALLAFCKAVLNSKAQAAWSIVAPTEPVVREAFPHDPEDADFDDKSCPALFIWRPEGDFERIADDALTDKTALRLLYLFAPATQQAKAARVPFFNGVCKVLAAAIEAGRDPAWVQTGDTDPNAATRGTLIYQAGGFSKMDFHRQKMGGIRIETIEGTEVRAWDGVLASIDVWELRERDPGAYAASKLAYTITDPDDDTYVLVSREL